VTSGDVVLLWFPFSHTEPEPYKKRPVLILTDAIPALADEALLVAMITSNARRVKRPKVGDIVIDEWQEAGLNGASVIRTRRLWTAETRDIAKALGVVKDETLDEARRLVRAMLD
jgi:mRNA-degrading endonuclease toxin of MazEF toxin-antitoxin module